MLQLIVRERAARIMALVLDNGAYSLKVGLADAAEPRVIPNCITRYDPLHRSQHASSPVGRDKCGSG